MRLAARIRHLAAGIARAMIPTGRVAFRCALLALLAVLTAALDKAGAGFGGVSAKASHAFGLLAMLGLVGHAANGAIDRLYMAAQSAVQRLAQQLPDWDDWTGGM